MALLVGSAVVVLACNAISGLDGDFELSTSNSSKPDAVDGGLTPAMDAGADASTADDGGTPCTVGVSCRSCKEIHDSSPDFDSGVYAIAAKDGTLSVYCEMTLADGGWTLAGRSTSGGSSSSFGWYSNTGAPDDDTKPYSLGLDRVAFRPSEILFGSVSSGKGWGPSVYLKSLGESFWKDNRDTAIAIEPLVKVKGNCPGGDMHKFAGFTSRTDIFFFRDQAADDLVFGLRPNGWDANKDGVDPCDYTSLLSTNQGMIFVR
ncbi:MAG TPA: fibrinogen-like YCDxxxxGGGW domain-containing protein [Labilithrix sp.]|nr:fibrinogen-like YCDxxxxGGGW domain-containing protein [Labilithrix sp.]